MRNYFKTFKDKWRLASVIIFFLVLWGIFSSLLCIAGIKEGTESSFEDILLGAACAFGITLFGDLTCGIGRENKLF